MYTNFIVTIWLLVFMYLCILLKLNHVYDCIETICDQAEHIKFLVSWCNLNFLLINYGHDFYYIFNRLCFCKPGHIFRYQGIYTRSTEIGELTSYLANLVMVQLANTVCKVEYVLFEATRNFCNIPRMNLAIILTKNNVIFSMVVFYIML